ncbi:hypothetical protein SERLADRAFT_443529 [Serpula lacrymans var. lacrymans S7.9]|uniref:Uncharacterized protein n=1 Tax=Serpula lacrymans var. lacrymans (strain S7.9) TaxID=578457 RepID=F8PCN7_SERL9|nr:uncharacterized protein SERLADRAFT_443529 [Serpula lacrymans var. lacrymans S7.9]EGO18986.1 hypothetical protein SERLADRAFT_443529 [Serpula lacrymans var. lacrymans S7.9]
MIFERAHELMSRKKSRVESAENSGHGEGHSGDVCDIETTAVEIANPTSPVAHSLDIDSDTPLSQRRTRRTNRRLPKRFRDILPQPSLSLPSSIQQPLSAPQPGCESRSPPLNEPPPSTQTGGALTQTLFRTVKNIFGVLRQYTHGPPSHNASDHQSPHELCTPLYPHNDSMNILSSSSSEIHPQCSTQSTNPYHPYPNKSTLLLGDWYWNHGARKSQENFRMLCDIIGEQGFSPADVSSANWRKIDESLVTVGDSDGNSSDWLDDGWRTSPVTISVPFHKRMADPGPKEFITADFHYRSILSVVQEKLANEHEMDSFHYVPYELHWQPEGQDETQLYGDLYTSPAFVEENQRLQDSPPEPGCDLERCILALMFWSDATHLTSFGNAKLWPLYMFFGNDTKYRRCKPSCHLCHHIAYFQTLPDSFKDFANAFAGGKGVNDAFNTHCHREFMHAQWTILLDKEFIEACKHGLVITCSDGIKRRFYLRIFTYSADYPEKVLLTSIRNLGACPCPRCLIPKDCIPGMGTKQDMRQRKTLARVNNSQYQRKVDIARSLIYEKNHAVNSNAVERLLKEESLVPTLNAFSAALTPLGVNIYSLFVVDILHEVELGVWKAIFIHLICILESHGEGSVHKLDQRYRNIPPFGQDTIRRFSTNSSEMKKMAAHDYEDLLQCAIPAFEGLLPEPHNKNILNLLFIMAQWHGLAKLRMHSDETLEFLDQATTLLGHQLCKFQQETCPAFNTKELQREIDARNRRQAKQQSSSSNARAPLSNNNARQPKAFNLNTYKVHALGDYAATIRRLGTTDSYSTQIGELEHRTPKASYSRTSKKVFIKQITKIERHENIPASPETHHHIGKAQNHSIDIQGFLQKRTGDPAIKEFLTKLRAHLLPRLKVALLTDQNKPAATSSETGTFAGDNALDGSYIIFHNNRIYHHNIIRLNYTTYDIRRAQDVVNINTSHNSIMMLSDRTIDSGHLFLYARVLGIYHANVIYAGPGSYDYQAHRMEFLWVRWYEPLRDSDCNTGWHRRQLDSFQFLPTDHQDAFGFVDPADILRICHVIPRFSEGPLHPHRIGTSLSAKDSADWKTYYVNRFVDRDIMMRYYYGYAPGHLYAKRSRGNTEPPCGIPDEIAAATVTDPADEVSNHARQSEAPDLLGSDAENHEYEGRASSVSEDSQSTSSDLPSEEGDQDDGLQVYGLNDESDRNFD